MSARQQGQTRVVDLELFDDDGQRVAMVDQLTLRTAPVFSLKRAMAKPHATSDVLNEWLYQFVWELQDKPEASTTQTDGGWVILQDMGGIGAQLAQTYAEQKLACAYPI